MDARMDEDRQRKQTSAAVGQYVNRLKESRSYQLLLLDKGYKVQTCKTARLIHTLLYNPLRQIKSESRVQLQQLCRE